MALIGTIEPFKTKGLDITTYLERIDQLFVCNEITEEKKVPLFLTLVGEAYGVLKDLLAPSLPNQKTFEQFPVDTVICSLYNSYTFQYLVLYNVKVAAIL
jgi:hypothetical protein